MFSLFLPLMLDDPPLVPNSSMFHTIQVIYPPHMNFEDDLAKVSLAGGSVQRAGRWEAKHDNSVFRVMEMPVHSSVPRCSWGGDDCLLEGKTVVFFHV